MPIILSIETATPACSVALHSNGQLLAHSHLFISQSASSKLAIMIDEILKRCEIKPQQVDAIAVSEGPGSYTGLRIGVATAKGMCYTLTKPLIAVNTLASMVRTLRHQRSEPALLCPMLDARRMEVYCLLADKEEKILEDTQAKVIDQKSFQDLLTENKILFFGNGADKCKEIIQHQNAIFISGIYPSAVQIGELANEKLNANQIEDTATFEPLYLKDFLIKKPKATI